MGEGATVVGQPVAPSQPSFDSYAAEQAKNAAIDTAGKHADAGWTKAARFVLQGLANRRETLTTDDVWKALDLMGVSTHENRAMANVMKYGAAQGWIAKTREKALCHRPERHGGEVTVWRSLIVSGSEVNR